MATDDVNLAERTGSLVESHKGYDGRVIFFYFAAAALLLVLAGGLAYQQVIKTAAHGTAEKVQNQRRILIPGPRGNILDRNGVVLVGNRPRFAVMLHLDELKTELRREHIRIHNNYLAAGEKKDVPSYAQLEQLARVSLVQRYLDQLNTILDRSEQVDAHELQRHFERQLLLPYPLLTDLEPTDFAKLVERLPVRSPLEPTTTIARDYPFGSSAAHTLGYVGATDAVDAEDFPGDDLRTFKMAGTVGRAGLEQSFDSLLQGEAGGSIVRVDPTGFKVKSPDLPHRLPVQGKDLATSLDIDLQLAAEEAIGDKTPEGQVITGAAVAVDVATGEVLVLASKPDYDLSKFRAPGTIADIEARHAWTNLAMNGFYAPGSTFKIVTTIAGLRRGVLPLDEPIVDCQGYLKIGNRLFPCEIPPVHHGELLLRDAIAKSCEIFFYKAGELTTSDSLAAEARRFHLDRRTGIELPGESGRMIIPDAAWKLRVKEERWFPGDTALTATGQGFVQVSPLQMACFAASVGRGEVWTQPTLVHEPDRPRQHTEPIGLTPAQRAALIDGMVACTTTGTAKTLTTIEAYRIPGVRIAGKTGTAQKEVFHEGKAAKTNNAWFICFAPAENPEIAVAVVIEGDTPGEEFGGGAHAAPVADAILKKYFEKKHLATSPLGKPFKAE